MSPPFPRRGPSSRRRHPCRDGSGSLDADGDSLSYHWSVGNNPGGKRSVAGRANGCSRKRNGRKRRGKNDERRFPWGDEDPNLYALTFPEGRLLNYNNITSETAPSASMLMASAPMACTTLPATSWNGSPIGMTPATTPTVPAPIRQAPPPANNGLPEVVTSWSRGRWSP